MSDLSPRRPPGRASRRRREQSAYALTLATGGLALAAVVVLVLSIVGIMGFQWFVLLAVLAAAAGYLLKRTLNP
jgi:fatty acid desaturase